MKLTEKVLSELATNYVHLKELELALASTGETKKFLKAIEKGNSSLETLKLILNNDENETEEALSTGDQLVLTTLGKLLDTNKISSLKSLYIKYLTYYNPSSWQSFMQGVSKNLTLKGLNIFTGTRPLNDDDCIPVAEMLKVNKTLKSLEINYEADLGIFGEEVVNTLSDALHTNKTIESFILPGAFNQQKASPQGKTALLDFVERLKFNTVLKHISIMGHAVLSGSYIDDYDSILTSDVIFAIADMLRYNKILKSLTLAQTTGAIQSIGLLVEALKHNKTLLSIKHSTSYGECFTYQGDVEYDYPVECPDVRKYLYLKSQMEWYLQRNKNLYVKSIKFFKEQSNLLDLNSNLHWLKWFQVCDKNIFYQIALKSDLGMNYKQLVNKLVYTISDADNYCLITGISKEYAFEEPFKKIYLPNHIFGKKVLQYLGPDYLWVPHNNTESIMEEFFTRKKTFIISEAETVLGILKMHVVKIPDTVYDKITKSDVKILNIIKGYLSDIQWSFKSKPEISIVEDKPIISKPKLLTKRKNPEKEKIALDKEYGSLNKFFDSGFSSSSDHIPKKVKPAKQDSTHHSKEMESSDTLLGLTSSVPGVSESMISLSGESVSSSLTSDFSDTVNNY